MVHRTHAELDLINDYMTPAYDDAEKGNALLHLFIQDYGFDMRNPKKENIGDIKKQWEMVGKILYAITDYFDRISEKLGEVLNENSEPKTKECYEKEELRKEAAGMLEQVEDEKIIKFVHDVIKSGYLEDKAGKK